MLHVGVSGKKGQLFLGGMGLSCLQAHSPSDGSEQLSLIIFHLCIFWIWNSLPCCLENFSNYLTFLHLWLFPSKPLCKSLHWMGIPHSGARVSLHMLSVPSTAPPFSRLFTWCWQSTILQVHSVSPQGFALLSIEPITSCHSISSSSRFTTTNMADVSTKLFYISSTTLLNS